jgi:hypothetical protein
MNGEEFGHKLLAEIRAKSNEAMKPLDAALCRTLGLEERKPPQAPAPIPQMEVPPEFPQRRVKYDPKTGMRVDSVVVNSLIEFGKLARERPELPSWSVEQINRGD